jgi:hypothetical protein
MTYNLSPSQRQPHAASLGVHPFRTSLRHFSGSLPNGLLDLKSTPLEPNTTALGIYLKSDSSSLLRWYIDAQEAKANMKRRFDPETRRHYWVSVPSEEPRDVHSAPSSAPPPSAGSVAQFKVPKVPDKPANSPLLPPSRSITKTLVK